MGVQQLHTYRVNRQLLKRAKQRGYCLCDVNKKENETNVCPCEEFLETGVCKCGVFVEN
jgi:ferredoxin-thioredoxin reductase catalytic subunit